MNLWSWIKKRERLLVGISAVVFALSWIAAIVLYLWEKQKLELSLDAFVMAFCYVAEIKPGQSHSEISQKVAQLALKATIGFAGLYTYFRLMGANFGLIKVWLAYHGHVVICGMGRKGKQLAEDLLAKGDQVVVIDKGDLIDDEVRLRHLGAVVVKGDASAMDVLRNVRIDKARTIVCLTGDDRLNLTIAQSAREIIAEHAAKGNARPALRCFCHVENVGLRRLLAEHALFRHEENFFDGQLVNVWSQAARVFLGEHSPDQLVDTMSDLAPQSHVVLVGDTHFLRSLVIQLALLSHFRNGKVPRVSLVCSKAEAALEELATEYPALPRLLNLHPINARFETLSVAQVLDVDGSNGEAPPVCLTVVDMEDEVTTLSVSRFIARLHTRPSRVVACASRRSGWTKAVDEGAMRDSGLILFDANMACTAESLLKEGLDREAEFTHNQYLENRIAEGATLRTSPTLMPWNELSDTVKGWNRHQLDHLPVKVRAAGCEIAMPDDPRPEAVLSDDEVEAVAIMEHKRWMADLLLSGWVYGPTRDWKLRTNKNLVPYEELSELEKEYDRRFVRSIPEILELRGRKLVRAVDGSPA